MPVNTKSEKSNYLDRIENVTRGNLSAKKVAVYTYDASTDTLRPGTTTAPTTQRYDYANSSIIYTAYAPIGTGDDEPGWTITKYDLSNSADADGKVKINGVWDDRTTETYA
jgi:hypothetical protein